MAAPWIKAPFQFELGIAATNKRTYALGAIMSCRAELHQIPRSCRQVNPFVRSTEPRPQHNARPPAPTAQGRDSIVVPNFHY